MKTRLGILLTLLAVAGCGADAQTSFEVSNEGGFSGATAVPVDTSLLERIAKAPYETEFKGRRRVSSTAFLRDGRVEELTYLEDVVSDGAGLFAVDPGKVVEPELSDARAQIFRMVQKGREEFFFNHRDFRVRDLDLFLSNYTVVVDPLDDPLLGRDCLHLTIRRNGEAVRRYELDVDSATGLILALREHDALDRVVGEVVWEQLSFARLTPQERVRAVRHDPTWRGARPSMGLDALAVHAPRVLPPGFQLLEQRIVTDPLGEEWYELVYGDGVEQLFVLFALGGSHRTKVAPDEEVLLFRHGAWIVADGQLREERVIVLGKIERDELVLMLESCL